MPESSAWSICQFRKENFCFDHGQNRFDHADDSGIRNT